MTKELFKELRELEAANEAATEWGAAVGARHERIKSIRQTLGLKDKQPARTVSFTIPEGCHLVALYNYTNHHNNLRPIGIYAHLIMKAGWYDDEGQSLYGTSITGDYCLTEQEAIDSAYAKILEHVRQVNEEIPLRKAKTEAYLSTISTPTSIKKEAEDLLKLLGL